MKFQPQPFSPKPNTLKAKALLVLLGLSIAAFALPSHADVAATYNKTCGTCHDSGALNAPKKGDTATWSRLQSQKGMDGLVQSTKQGMPQMPAMGLCQTCSEQDFKDLINYMSK